MCDTTRLVSPDGTWWVRLQGVLAGRPSDMQPADPLSPTAACAGDRSGQNPRGLRTACGHRPPGRIRTATPATNGGKWRYPAALSEFRPPFLNGVQRSVNRKVQGSNPWSGANFEFENRAAVNPGLTRLQQPYSNRIATRGYPQTARRLG